MIGSAFKIEAPDEFSLEQVYLLGCIVIFIKVFVGVNDAAFPAL